MHSYMYSELECHEIDTKVLCCSGCDGVYEIHEDKVSHSKTRAYEHCIDDVEDLLLDTIKTNNLLSDKIKYMKTIEIMANSLLYSVGKAFKTIKRYSIDKEHKKASKECSDMLNFIKTNRSKARNNELVKDLIKRKL
jgi:cytoplasmic iron level regulating protein YaaA (DUF328/UPF0246 family)